MKQTRAAYVANLEKMFTLAGEPNGSARARALLDFETKIATVHWTRIASRDATKIYNKMSVAELQTLAPGFDFATYIKGLGANVTDVLVAPPSDRKSPRLNSSHSCASRMHSSASTKNNYNS